MPGIGARDVSIDALGVDTPPGCAFGGLSRAILLEVLIEARGGATARGCPLAGVAAVDPRLPSPGDRRAALCALPLPIMSARRQPGRDAGRFRTTWVAAVPRVRP